ncbi:hypothetical protein VTK56DRAFT_8074 [Thermocarpiscus australiensis]
MNPARLGAAPAPGEEGQSALQERMPRGLESVACCDDQNFDLCSAVAMASLTGDAICIGSVTRKHSSRRFPPPILEKEGVSNAERAASRNGACSQSIPTVIEREATGLSETRPTGLSDRDGLIQGWWRADGADLGYTAFSRSSRCWLYHIAV